MERDPESGLETERENRSDKKHTEPEREHQFDSLNRPEGEIARFPLSVADSRPISLITRRNWDWRVRVSEGEKQRGSDTVY